MKIGIVVSEYNYDITMMMLQRAEEHAKFLNLDVTKVLRVPGDVRYSSRSEKNARKNGYRCRRDTWRRNQG